MRTPYGVWNPSVPLADMRTVNWENGDAIIQGGGAQLLAGGDWGPGNADPEDLPPFLHCTVVVETKVPVRIAATGYTRSNVAWIADIRNGGSLTFVVPRGQQVYGGALQAGATDLGFFAVACREPHPHRAQVTRTYTIGGGATSSFFAPPQGAIGGQVSCITAPMNVVSRTPFGWTFALAAGGAPQDLGPCAPGEQFEVTNGGGVAGTLRVAWDTQVP